MNMVQIVIALRQKLKFVKTSFNMFKAQQIRNVNNLFTLEYCLILFHKLYTVKDKI